MKTQHKTSSTLGMFSIWAIGVGLVISGQSFGWNLGWGITGPVAFFIPFLIAALLYFSLIQCLGYLSVKFPNVDGPQDYLSNTWGPSAGTFISFALLIEFLFATPAVATSIGEYLSFLNKSPQQGTWIAVSFLGAFCVLNILEIKVNIWITVLLTLLAIGELLVFSGAIVSHVSVGNLTNSVNNHYDIISLGKALPFAIWIFLAIEGVALYTKFIDKSRLKRTITRGYNIAFITLFFLAALILIITIGSINWSNESFNAITVDNHPMPKALSMILGPHNPIVSLFTFIGLFGLIASLQGVSLAATEQILVLLQNSGMNHKAKRLVATSAVLVVGLAAILGDKVSFLIEFSVFGAVCLYIGIGASVLDAKNTRTRTNNPRWVHPFALLTIVISLLAVFVFAKTQVTSFLVCAFLTAGFLVYNIIKRRKRPMLEGSIKSYKTN